MAEKKKKTELLVASENTEFEQAQSTEEARARRRRLESKRVRRVSPLGFRVLVAIRKEGNQTEGGLYLPEGAKQNMEESLLAEVLEVASAVDDSTDEETNVSGIPLGALVLIPKSAGTRVPWDDNLRIVETKEVLAIVNEISLT